MITSTRNPRIVAARKLSQRKHRQLQDRFLAEGLQILTMATEAREADGGAHVIPTEVFYCADRFRSPQASVLLDRLVAAGAVPVPVSPHVLDTLSDRDTSQGLAATFAIGPFESPIALLSAPPVSGGGPVLVLDRLQDPGNLGTLIRTADAGGATAVVLIEPCADPFDPKTVRGTMGSIFVVPLIRSSDGSSVCGRLRDAGRRLLGTDVHQGQSAWGEHDLAGPVALFLGNEARGLSSELAAEMDASISLPMAGRAESLNVAVAGGILLYEWIRVNRS